LPLNRPAGIHVEEVIRYLVAGNYGVFRIRDIHKLFAERRPLATTPFASATIQFATILLLMSRDDRVGFDFDESRRVDQFDDFDDRGGGADVFENLAVDAGDGFPLADVDDEHAGTDDVFEPAVEGFDRRADDGQRARGLSGDVGRVGAVGVDADRAGDGDGVAAADGAAVAHERLPFRAAGGTSPAGAIVDGDLDVGHGKG
jgi:hypothetical protein